MFCTEGRKLRTTGSPQNSLHNIRHVQARRSHPEEGTGAAAASQISGAWIATALVAVSAENIDPYRLLSAKSATHLISAPQKASSAATETQSSLDDITGERSPESRRLSQVCGGRPDDSLPFISGIRLSKCLPGASAGHQGEGYAFMPRR